MSSKQRPVATSFVGVSLLVASMAISGCRPGQLLGPTFTPTPTSTHIPTPTLTPTPAPPTYSEVLATYPDGVKLCETVANITEVGPDGEPSGFEGIFYGFDFKCYGIKLTAKVPVTIGGVTYPVGTKITVDRDQNYIVVSSWD
jgi:hypothetical protein